MNAGAICRFERGHGDSMAFRRPLDRDCIAVTGLGPVKGPA